MSGARIKSLILRYLEDDAVCWPVNSVCLGARIELKAEEQHGFRGRGQPAPQNHA